MAGPAVTQLVADLGGPRIRPGSPAVARWNRRSQSPAMRSPRRRATAARCATSGGTRRSSACHARLSRRVPAAVTVRRSPRTAERSRRCCRVSLSKIEQHLVSCRIAAAAIAVAGILMAIGAGWPPGEDARFRGTMKVILASGSREAAIRTPRVFGANSSSCTDRGRGWIPCFARSCRLPTSARPGAAAPVQLQGSLRANPTARRRQSPERQAWRDGGHRGPEVPDRRLGVVDEDHRPAAASAAR